MSFETELRERLRDSASHIDTSDALFERAEQLHQRHVRKVQLGGALGVAAVLALGVVAGPWLADRFDPSPAPIIGEEQSDAPRGPLHERLPSLIVANADAGAELGIPGMGRGDSPDWLRIYPTAEGHVVLRTAGGSEGAFVSLVTPEGDVSDLYAVDVAGIGTSAVDLHGVLQLGDVDGDAWGGPGSYALLSVVRADGQTELRLAPLDGRDSSEWGGLLALPAGHALDGVAVIDDDPSGRATIVVTSVGPDGAVETAVTRPDGAAWEPGGSVPAPSCADCSVRAVDGLGTQFAFVEWDERGRPSLRVTDTQSGAVIAEAPLNDTVTIDGGVRLEHLGSGVVVNASPDDRWFLDIATGVLIPLDHLAAGYVTGVVEPLAEPGSVATIPPLLDTWSVLDEIGVPTDGIVNRVAYRAETAGEEQVFILRYDQVAERPYAVSLATPDGITDLVTVLEDDVIDLHGSVELEGVWHAIVSVTGPQGSETSLIAPDGTRAGRTVEVVGPDVRLHDVSPMLIDESATAQSLTLMPTYARGDGGLVIQPASTSESSPELRAQEAVCRGCELLAVAGWDRHVALVDRAGDGTQTLRLVDAVTGDVLAEHVYEDVAGRIVGGPDGFVVNAAPERAYVLGLDGRLLETPTGGFWTFAKASTSGGTDPSADAPAPTPGWSALGDSPLGDDLWHAVAAGDLLVAIGGSSEPGGGAVIHTYDTATGRWASPGGAPDAVTQYGTATAWTGTEVVLLGGQPLEGPDSLGTPTVPAIQGWAYDPSANSWREIPEAPLDPRLDFTATWTGEELIVWGGMRSDWNEGDGTYDVTTYADGAAWEPQSNTWRRLADAPLAPRAAHGAVWNGRRLIVFGGGDADDFEGEFAFTRSAGGAAAYDPTADSWATIAAPDEVGPLAAFDWTGDRILYWTGHLGREANGSWFDPGRSWDPVTGASDPMPAPPFGTRREYSVDHAWVDGVGWIVWGGGCGEGCNTTFRDGAVLSPDATAWTPLVPPAGRIGYGATAVWVGEQLITLGGDGENWNHSDAGTVSTEPFAWTPPGR